MNRSLKLLVVVSLLGLGLSLWLAHDGVPRPLRATWHQLTGRGSLDSDAAPYLAPFASGVGQSNAYDLRLDTKVTVPQQGQVYHFVVSGTWQLTTLERGPKSTLVHARLLEPIVTTPEQNTDSSRLHALAEELGRDTYLQYDPSGAVTKLRLDAKLSTLSQGLVKGVVALSQIVRPSGAKEAWTTRETDGLGEYEASYVMRSQSGVGKGKTRYTRLSGANDPMLNSKVEVSVASSKVSADAKPEGGLLALVADEQLRTEGSLLPGAVSATILRLKAMGETVESRVTAQLLAAAKKTPGAPLDQLVKTNGYSSDADRARVGERKLDEIIDDLAKLRSPPLKKGEPNGETLPTEQRQERDRLFIALSAELRLDDAAVDAVLARIRAGSADQQILRDALVSAGTEHAQHALIELMDFYKDTDTTNRRMTMIGMSSLRQPSPETIDYMKSMLDDAQHGRQARYGMGSLIMSLNQNDADTVSEPLALLQQRFHDAKDPAERADFANALGNTHLLDVRPELDAALNDDSPDVRMAGINGLTHQAGDDVDSVIAHFMTSDPNELVRDDAIDVAKRRDPSPALLDALTTCMRLDKEILVRRSAISAAAALQQVVPQLSESLQWVAQNDPEPKLRELAAASL